MKFLKRGIAILLISTVAFASFGCYGNFVLFNKINKWNGSLGNKWINTIVYWVLWIIPVYPISWVIDGLILHTIEFWTGSNPLAMNEGEREVQIVNKDGVNYEITATKNRFDVLVLDGEKEGKLTSLVFNDNTMIWSVESGNEKIELAKIDSENQGRIHFLIPGMEGKVVYIDQM